MSDYLTIPGWAFKEGKTKHFELMSLLEVQEFKVTGYFATMRKTVYDVVIECDDIKILMISFRKDQMNGTDFWWQINKLKHYNFITNEHVREFFRAMAVDFVIQEGIVCEPITLD